MRFPTSKTTSQSSLCNRSKLIASRVCRECFSDVYSSLAGEAELSRSVCSISPIVLRKQRISFIVLYIAECGPLESSSQSSSTCELKNNKQGMSTKAMCICIYTVCILLIYSTIYGPRFKQKCTGLLELLQPMLISAADGDAFAQFIRV